MATDTEIEEAWVNGWVQAYHDLWDIFAIANADEALAAAEQRATDAEARAADAHATLAALRRREGSTLANKLRRANAEIERLRGDLTRTIEQWEADSIMLHGAAPATQSDERAAAERATIETALRLRAATDAHKRHGKMTLEEIARTVGFGHGDTLWAEVRAAKQAHDEAVGALLALDATDGAAKEGA